MIPPKQLVPKRLRSIVHANINRRRTVATLASFYYGERPARKIASTRLASLQPQPNPSPIPPFVWSTWNTNKFGRTHGREILRFRELNPDHSFVILSDRDAAEFVKEHFAGQEIADIYFGAHFGAMRADILRYLLLYSFGGWYFDIKSSCTAPLSTLVASTDELLVTYEDIRLDPRDSALPCDLRYRDRRVAQWVIASKPGHAFIELVLQRIVENAPRFANRRWREPKSAIIDFTGPGLFTRSLHEFAGSNGLSGVVDTDTSINGAGVYDVPGGWARYAWLRSYASARDERILSMEF